VSGSQLLKQPDVLMLHHVLPDLAPDARAADLDLYLPRTCHGSSLSPSVSASVLARAGRPDEALELLRLSLDLDLHDRTGTTAAGIHLAAAAGAWQAVLFGFMGARVRAGTVCLSPVLPREWPRLETRFQCLGGTVTVVVDARAARLTVRSTVPVVIRIGERPTVSLRAGRPWSTSWAAHVPDRTGGVPA
jgi:trehalose/maltose hydrolase-like predicted phosphorylase